LQSSLLVCVCPVLGQEVTGPKTPKEVTDWLIDHAIPINSVEPLSGFSDFGPVGSLLNGFRLVAVGEATHGTREFFQFKHRVFEFLVERLGFTSFAMEAAACASAICTRDSARQSVCRLVAMKASNTIEPQQSSGTAVTRCSRIEIVSERRSYVALSGADSCGKRVCRSPLHRLFQSAARGSRSGALANPSS